MLLRPLTSWWAVRERTVERQARPPALRLVSCSVGRGSRYADAELHANSVQQTCSSEIWNRLLAIAECGGDHLAHHIPWRHAAAFRSHRRPTIVLVGIQLVFRRPDIFTESARSDAPRQLLAALHYPLERFPRSNLPEAPLNAAGAVAGMRRYRRRPDV